MLYWVHSSKGRFSGWAPQLIVLGLCFVSGLQDLQALPIGFGHTEGGLDYNELLTPNFLIYHDAETKEEAQSIAESMEAARPHLESWIGAKRKKALPVISSAVASGASFANFLTDAIELQTLGQGHRDLYWHELVHSTMYGHLDNVLGHSGSILHLLWMPSWFIEGLPEALTVSIGSDQQASYERYHALSGKWPTYERLHSLYGGQAFSMQGYATSGAFVAYLFRKYGGESLPKVLDKFYWNTMPWWWPWAGMPFSPFLPLDDALQMWTGKKGPDLYEEYKRAAKAHWEQNSRGPHLALRPGRRLFHSPGIHVWQEGQNLVYAQSDKSGVALKKINWDETSGFGMEAPYSRLSDAFDSVITAASPDVDVRIGLSNDVYQISRLIGQQMKVTHGDRQHDIQHIIGRTQAIAWTGRYAAWIEARKGVFRFCRKGLKVDAQGKTKLQKKSECSREVRQPYQVQVLGMNPLASHAHYSSGIYFSEQQQTLGADVHQLWYWNIESNQFLPMGPPRFDQPVSLVPAHDLEGVDNWLLSGERTRQVIRALDKEGKCKGQLDFADHMVAMWSFRDGSVALRMRTGTIESFVRLPKERLNFKPCETPSGHTSPLLVAMNHQGSIKLSDAIAASDLWSPQSSDITTRPATLALGKDPKIQALPVNEAERRFRPAFSMPWLGLDAQGINFGFLSLPLMDHRQNETVTLNAAIGLESRYPSTQLSYINTKYWPLLQADAFRYQEWNGPYRGADGLGRNSFVDRRGARLSSQLYFAATKINLRLGLESSYIEPYLGRVNIVGGLNEFNLTLSRPFRLGDYGLFLMAQANAAPEAMNENFDYHRLRLFSNVSRSFEFLSSRLAMSAEYSATRGPKRRDLQEVYRPMRIFIPGDGTGFNNINNRLLEFFPTRLGQEGGICGWDEWCSSLFFGTFRDTQARFTLNYSFPLIRNFDRLIRMFYIKSLEFGSFVNYGSAWNEADGPRLAEFIPAAGASADLLFDLNGVRFNIGLGMGQVLRDNEATMLYTNFSFDNILEVSR